MPKVPKDTAEAAEGGLRPAALFAVGDIATVNEDQCDERTTYCRAGERVVVTKCRPNRRYDVLWEETWKSKPKAHGFWVWEHELSSANVNVLAPAGEKTPTKQENE